MQPRNYFTDAADWFLSRNSDPRNMSDEEYALTKSKMEHWVKNGICFVLPCSGSFFTEEELQRLTTKTIGVLRPPYPVCILEYTTDDANGGLKLIVIVETKGDKVTIYMLSASNSGGVWTPPAMTAHSTIESPEYDATACLPGYIRNKQSEWAKGRNFLEDAKIMLQALALRPAYEFTYAVNLFHTTTDDIQPPERLNRKRLKNGKVPLFTYKVLTIGKKKRRTAHQGGTHASPRSHLRRGYYRMSAKGVRHWVQPCMVKGETPGFVHKDYVVEPSDDPAPMALG